MRQNFIQQSKDYERIEKAIRFLGDHFADQPDLGQMARHIHMSEFHFQRTFKRWAGISPKRFLQYMTKEYAKELLKSSSVLDASLASGLSGPGRLHDLMVQCEAMTPGDYKHKAKGLTIEYGYHPTPLGECFMAVTDRGICQLAFIDKTKRKETLDDFKRHWKNALIQIDQEKTFAFVHRIFDSSRSIKRDRSIPVICKGTNFQIKVWEALLKIPSGRVVSYKTIAAIIGRPQALRAVGTAVGKNPIALLIPCHRVIREEGGIGGYRWGTARKRAILSLEAAKQHAN